MLLRWMLCALLLCISLGVSAEPLKPIPVEQAFHLSGKTFGPDTVVLNWQITPGYYLYRDRFYFKIIAPESAHIGSVLLPNGLQKHNEVLGNYQLFEEDVSVSIPIINVDPKNTVLQVKYQGCAKDGYCYPPIEKEVNVNFTQSFVQISDVNQLDENESLLQKQPLSEQDRVAYLLFDHHLLTVLVLLMGLGLLLSFTPCVLPMVPILSGIIAGHGVNITPGKALRLSAVYVLSMAITYAIAGSLVGWLGGSVQAWFQQPWVLILYSLLFILLALSFFGFYQIRLPQKFEERVANVSRHQRAGSYAGVAIMGCLATLIVSPCASPALIGILSYIGKTGNALFGAIALFALGLGMGLPLLLVGVAGGKLLPKAGTWMVTVERIFGVIFLGLAIWMLGRLLPGWIILLLWGALTVVCSIYMGAFSKVNGGWNKLWKGLGLLLFFYGIYMVTGAAMGNTDPFRPLAKSAKSGTLSTENDFNLIDSSDDLQTMLAKAKELHKPVLLDFYADWCVSCKEWDANVFAKPEIRSIMSDFLVVRADVTNANKRSKALMQSFDVIAPPTILFFSAEGNFMPEQTIVGEMSVNQFSDHLQKILQTQ